MEARDRLLCHLPDARLLPAILPGQHHVRLEESPLERHAMLVERVEEHTERRDRHVVAPVDRVVAVHEHFGLDDRDDPGFL